MKVRRTRKPKDRCGALIFYILQKKIKLKQTKFIFKLQPSLLHPNLSSPCKCITSTKRILLVQRHHTLERATCNHTSSKVQNLHNLNHSCTTLVPSISKSIEVRIAFPKHWEIEKWYFRSIRISKSESRIEVKLLMRVEPSKMCREESHNLHLFFCLYVCVMKRVSIGEDVENGFLTRDVTSEKTFQSESEHKKVRNEYSCISPCMSVTIVKCSKCMNCSENVHLVCM